VDPAIKSLCHDEVQVALYQGQNQYGAPIYGTPTTYLGRVERHFMTQMGPSGQQLVDETVLYLDNDAVIDERSQLTLAGRIVPIEALYPVPDEVGNIDHYKVML
jgi:hypothetical protein